MLIGISALPQDYLSEAEPSLSIEVEDLSKPFQNVSRITPDENGHYIMDDMYLDPFQFAEFTDDPEVHALARQAIKPESRRWPGTKYIKGEIPYVFAEPYDPEHKKRIEDAIEDFNDMFRTCLKIR